MARNNSTTRTWLIGDVQGCRKPLETLLETIDPRPGRDTLWFLGDLVNRGDDSLEVLKRIVDLGEVANAVLGNHDLHLLAEALGPDSRHGDNVEFRQLLAHNRADELLHWLRHRPLVHWLGSNQTLLLHAGVLPNWSLKKTRQLAAEVEQVLRGEDYTGFFAHMYGDKPRQWRESLSGWPRLRLITNVLTRLRYCDRRGGFTSTCSGPPGTQPEGQIPWFAMPNRKTRDTTIAFGHWSALGLLVSDHLIGLDTGAVWGGRLTALRLEDRKIVQVAGLNR